MVEMASHRTTVVLSADDLQALKRASRAEGLSQSQIIRKGIRTVTSTYRRHGRKLTGWLKLSGEERAAVLGDEMAPPPRR